VIHNAEARGDSALEPWKGRYYAVMQGISGQAKHVGAGTIASIDRLAEQIERVLEGGHEEVRKV
jgi:hypothetical protein